MAAVVTVTPASGVAKMSVVRVDVTGLASNDAAAYDSTPDPSVALGGLTEPEIRYYIKGTLDGQDTLRSHEFSPSQDGNHSWNSIVLPAAGTWTFAVCKSADDSVQDDITFVAS